MLFNSAFLRGEHTPRGPVNCQETHTARQGSGRNAGSGQATGLCSRTIFMSMCWATLPALTTLPTPCKMPGRCYAGPSFLFNSHLKLSPFPTLLKFPRPEISSTRARLCLHPGKQQGPGQTQRCPPSSPCLPGSTRCLSSPRTSGPAGRAPAPPSPSPIFPPMGIAAPDEPGPRPPSSLQHKPMATELPQAAASCVFREDSGFVLFFLSFYWLSENGFAHKGT